MAKRPPTQKEILEAKKRAKGSKETLTIYNRSKQLISINCKAPRGSDFYVASQDVRIPPGKRATLPKSRLWTSQIERLQKRGMISIISDSAKVEEKKQIMLDKKKAREAAKAAKNGKKKSEEIIVVTSEDSKDKEDNKDTDPSE